MIKSRNFELKPLCDQSSWDSFSQMYQYYAEHKDLIEKSFSEAAFDQNFQEPMNHIMLECDSRNPESSRINEWAHKFNELFHSNEDKIVIDTQVRDIPARYRKRVFFSHTWFIKHDI